MEILAITILLILLYIERNPPIDNTSINACIKGYKKAEDLQRQQFNIDMAYHKNMAWLQSIGTSRYWLNNPVAH